jgi:hypothetical protein
MRLSNPLLLASLGVLMAAASCTLITDVDRSKIPDGVAGAPGGGGDMNVTPPAGGEGGTASGGMPGNPGGAGATTNGGQGGNAGTSDGGVPNGGVPNGGAGADGGVGGSGDAGASGAVNPPVAGAGGNN